MGMRVWDSSERMPKFYVKSGQLRRIVDSPDARSAAFKAVQQSAYTSSGRSSPVIEKLGLFTIVSERGFSSRHRESFPTHYILVRAGPFEGF